MTLVNIITGHNSGGYNMLTNKGQSLAIYFLVIAATIFILSRVTKGYDPVKVNKGIKMSIPKRLAR